MGYVLMDDEIHKSLNIIKAEHGFRRLDSAVELLIKFYQNKTRKPHEQDAIDKALAKHDDEPPKEPEKPKSPDWSTEPADLPPVNP